MCLCLSGGDVVLIVCTLASALVIIVRIAHPCIVDNMSNVSIGSELKKLRDLVSMGAPELEKEKTFFFSQINGLLSWADGLKLVYYAHQVIYADQMRCLNSILNNHNLFPRVSIGNITQPHFMLCQTLAGKFDHGIETCET